MKAKGLKLISLIILLAMVFTAFGCDSTPEATTPNGNGELQGEDGGYIYINNIEKLNDYLKTQDVPDTFITPDMLTELGTFRAFYNTDDGDFTSYVYRLNHENRYLLRININCTPCHKSLPEISESLLGSTMAEVPENTQGFITSNGITYGYMKGLLFIIEWTANNVSYNIDLNTCVQQLEEMPSTLSEDSILRKLLSKDAEDQIAAFNQLKDMVTK